MIAEMYHTAVGLGKMLLFFDFLKTKGAHPIPQSNSFPILAETEFVHQSCNVPQSPRNV